MFRFFFLIFFLSTKQHTSPLSISFETPVSENQKPTYATDAYIEKVKQRFDVKVNYFAFLRASAMDGGSEKALG